MPQDDPFEPRLGRMRARGGKRQARFLNRILAAANLARGGKPGPAGRKGFAGGKIGRGVGVGRVLVQRDRLAAFRARRAIVKSRIVRLAGKEAANARAHLRYLGRDGTTREGAPGTLYGADADQVDGKAFLERGAGDRHQFRLIVSPEDGDQYPDLKPVIRRLMQQMEEDLGTRLEWVAVDHFNTGHPHSHVLLRGVDEQGKDLILARDYLACGIRERAGEILDFDLGPRTDREIEGRLRAEIDQERFTSIDRRLLGAAVDGIVGAAATDPFEHSFRAGRLAKLARMGLAEPIGAGRSRLAPQLEATLRQIGERGDILKTLQGALKEASVARAPSDLGRFDPDSSAPLIGAVIARGLSDELRDHHYLVVDGIDGRAHYVDIGRGDPEATIGRGMIVQVQAVRPEARAADRTVSAVAGANKGIYSTDAHLRHDADASLKFAETHVRRLEAMRRAGVGVERRPDGSWSIPADHVERAAAYEARLARDRPVQVSLLSPLPLDQLAGHDGETWLDQRLSDGRSATAREAGFGAQVRLAEQRRRGWLIDEGLLDPGSNRPLDVETLAVLRRRELGRIAGQLSRTLGLPFVEARRGDRIEGFIDRKVQFASGRACAVLCKSKEFTLVPWRPNLERALGRHVTARLNGQGIDWSVAAPRGRTIS